MTDTGGRPPRRRWLIVIVAVSLALNLFFIGATAGTAIMMREQKAPGGRFERIAGKLQLDQGQQALFHAFMTVMRQGGKTMREANLAIWLQIGDSTLDKAKIGPLLDKSVRNRGAFQEEVAAALAQFLDGLTPAQRARFVEASRNENQQQQRGPLRLMHALIH